MRASSSGNVCRCKQIIKRATNRKPQEADCLTRNGDACNHPRCRYHTHLRTCGGAWIKIKEPEPKKKVPKASNGSKQALPGSGKPPKGQGTLLNVFSRHNDVSQGENMSRSASVLEREPEGPTVFDLFDTALAATPWLASTAHQTTKGGSCGKDAAAPKVLETNLVNLLAPLPPYERAPPTVQRGGVSTGTPSPADSVGVPREAGTATQRSEQRHQGGFVDLTDDAEDESAVNKSAVQARAQQASTAVVMGNDGNIPQISLLSDSDDDLEPSQAAAGPSQGVKRKHAEHVQGPGIQSGVEGAALPKRQKGGESGCVEKGVIAVDLEAGTGIGDVAQHEGGVHADGDHSQVDKERANLRALCAAAATARLERSKKCDESPSVQENQDPGT
jgi:hypothetical protein